jgi:DNA modification methylase
MKPYYQDGLVTIYHGDAREVLPSLDPVDLVLTDPPYGMGKAQWDVFIDHEEWLVSARRSRTVALFSGVRGMFDYPRPDWTMAWVRVASTQRNGRFRGFNNWEPILVYGGDRITNDVVSMQNVQEHDAAEHPTSKPVRLMSAIATRLGGHTMLDPFVGSGTTLVAAKWLGRRTIGIEIEERYCEIAAQRCSQESLGSLFLPTTADHSADQQLPLDPEEAA